VRFPIDLYLSISKSAGERTLVSQANQETAEEWCYKVKTVIQSIQAVAFSIHGSRCIQ
jgi:hypothetical protein